jgi:hypothetical protein
MAKVSSIMGAMQEMASAFDGIVSQLNQAFDTLLYGVPEVSNGSYVVAEHSKHGRIEGHICGYLTENTVTVARESDGVLIHLHRNTIVKTEG